MAGGLVGNTRISRTELGGIQSSIPHAEHHSSVLLSSNGRCFAHAAERLQQSYQDLKGVACLKDTLVQLMTCGLINKFITMTTSLVALLVSYKQ